MSIPSRLVRRVSGAGMGPAPNPKPEGVREAAMRFLSMVKSTENQGPAPQALQDAMAKLIADSLKNGSLVQTGGVCGSSRGGRERSGGGGLNGVSGAGTQAQGSLGGRGGILTK